MSRNAQRQLFLLTFIKTLSKDEVFKRESHHHPMQVRKMNTRIADQSYHAAILSLIYLITALLCKGQMDWEGLIPNCILSGWGGCVCGNRTIRRRSQRITQHSIALLKRRGEDLVVVLAEHSALGEIDFIAHDEYVCHNTATGNCK